MTDMKYVYPAIFTPLSEGGFAILVPDLPGCRTFGETIFEAIEMAEDAVSMWLWDAENSQETIPEPSDHIAANDPDFVNLIKVDTDEYRRQYDRRAVKKTLSIPSWLNTEAERANAPFSQILQEGLKSYLGVKEPPSPHN